MKMYLSLYRLQPCFMFITESMTALKISLTLNNQIKTNLAKILIYILKLYMYFRKYDCIKNFPDSE